MADENTREVREPDTLMSSVAHPAADFLGPDLWLRNKHWLRDVAAFFTDCSAASSSSGTDKDAIEVRSMGPDLL